MKIGVNLWRMCGAGKSYRFGSLGYIIVDVPNAAPRLKTGLCDCFSHGGARWKPLIISDTMLHLLASTNHPAQSMSNSFKNHLETLKLNARDSFYLKRSSTILLCFLSTILCFLPDVTHRIDILTSKKNCPIQPKFAFSFRF